jgi:hypothetical protein
MFLSCQGSGQLHPFDQRRISASAFELLIPLVAESLALLWQIYSRCFSSLIQDRHGHR